MGRDTVIQNRKPTLEGACLQAFALHLLPTEEVREQPPSSSTSRTSDLEGMVSRPLRERGQRHLAMRTATVHRTVMEHVLRAASGERCGLFPSKLPWSLRHRASREILRAAFKRVSVQTGTLQPSETMHSPVDQRRLVVPSTAVRAALCPPHPSVTRLIITTRKREQPLLVPPEWVLSQGPCHRTAPSSFEWPEGRGLMHHVHPSCHDRALGGQRFGRDRRRHSDSRRSYPCHPDLPKSLRTMCGEIQLFLCSTSLSPLSPPPPPLPPLSTYQFRAS